MSSNKKILITIVIPTYNNDLLLKKSINSVVNQTFDNFELLIIDNYSTDKTSEIISEFKDTRISHIKIKNKGIIAKSRNLGIKLAKGEWVAFLDSDDCWYPKRLEKISNFLTKENLFDVVTTNEYKVFDKSSKRQKLFYELKGTNKYKSLLLFGNRLSPSATVVRRNFLKKHSILFKENKEFITVEDYDFWLMLAFNNAKFMFLKSFEGEYLMHRKNASNKINLHNKNLLNLLKFHVYEIQKFDKNKDILFAKILNFRKFSFSIREKNIFNSFFFFIRSPFYIISLLSKKILFTIKNELKFLLNQYNK